MLRAERFGGFGAGLADAGRGLLDQRRDRRRLGVDPRADLARASPRCGRAGCRALRKSCPRLRRPCRGCGAGCFDLGEARGEAVGRFGDQPVGFAGALGEVRRPAGRSSPPCAADSLPTERSCSASARAVCLGARQVLEQHRRCRCAPLRRRGRAPRRAAAASRCCESNSRVIPPSLPVASSPSSIRCCEIIVSSDAAVVDALRQHFEQRLERARFGAHRDDRAGEALGFLAPGAAEHQPDEAEQGQRPGGERDPLRDRRRRQRLAGERAARRPGGVAKPQRGKDGQRACRAPGARRCRAPSAGFRAHCSASKAGSTSDRRRWSARAARRSSWRRRRRLGARCELGSWQRQFTIFD